MIQVVRIFELLQNALPSQIISDLTFIYRTALLLVTSFVFEHNNGWDFREVFDVTVEAN